MSDDPFPVPDLLTLPKDASDRERLIALQFAMAAHIREQRSFNCAAREQRNEQNEKIESLTSDMKSVKDVIFGAKMTWKTIVGLGAFISGVAAFVAWVITALVGFPHILGK